jgi:hypothetical protein
VLLDAEYQDAVGIYGGLHQREDVVFPLNYDAFGVALGEDNVAAAPELNAMEAADSASFAYDVPGPNYPGRGRTEGAEHRSSQKNHEVGGTYHYG